MVVSRWTDIAELLRVRIVSPKRYPMSLDTDASLVEQLRAEAERRRRLAVALVKEVAGRKKKRPLTARRTRPQSSVPSCQKHVAEMAQRKGKGDVLRLSIPILRGSAAVIPITLRGNIEDGSNNGGMDNRTCSYKGGGSGGSMAE